jgi:hypothetical protein
VVSFGRDDIGSGRRRRKGGAPAAACCPAATTTMRDIGQRRKVREGSGEEEWLGGCGLGREVRYRGGGGYGGRRTEKKLAASTASRFCGASKRSTRTRPRTDLKAQRD